VIGNMTHNVIPFNKAVSWYKRNHQGAAIL
jgi:hypothetical protein